MKSLFLCIPFLWMISVINAQTINQPGEVRTISYEQGKKGAPVADVRIKSKGLTEVRSTADGKFTLPVKPDGGNIFTFEDVSRAGYEPVSPSREEFLSRKFAINPAAGVTLILAGNDQLSPSAAGLNKRSARRRNRKLQTGNQKFRNFRQK
ncbi:MAG: hypothetical protein IPF68_20230 [Bacteroidales bacterium]|nr:hypothetical protein [Bacteroidales bacterium]